MIVSWFTKIRIFCLVCVFLLTNHLKDLFFYGYDG